MKITLIITLIASLLHAYKWGCTYWLIYIQLSRIHGINGYTNIITLVTYVYMTGSYVHYIQY